MVFDDAINKAFLANVAGFWINSVIVVYKMSDDDISFIPIRLVRTVLLH